MGQHRHEFFEIAVVLSGSAIHAAGRFRHRIEAGDVLFLDSHHTHGYEEPRNLNLLNILIRERVLGRIGRELADRPGYHTLFTLSPVRDKDGFRQYLRLSPRETEQIAEWASRIEEAGRAARAARLLQEAYLTLIVDVVCRKHERTAARSAARKGVPARGGIPDGLGHVLSWIETNLAQPLRVADLAGKAVMSERTFQRAFRAATSLSPRAYVIRARLAHAAELLATAGPRETVTGIALRCGFDDSNYFSRSFRRFAGHTPTAYRKAGGKGGGRPRSINALDR